MVIFCHPSPVPNATPLTITMNTAATRPPKSAEPNPHQSTRRVPQAEVAYSTSRIATSIGSGPKPAIICSTAPAQAAANAHPGASRPMATAPDMSTLAKTRITIAAPPTAGLSVTGP